MHKSVRLHRTESNNAKISLLTQPRTNIPCTTGAIQDGCLAPWTLHIHGRAKKRKIKQRQNFTSSYAREEHCLIHRHYWTHKLAEDVSQAAPMMTPKNRRKGIMGRTPDDT